MIETLAIAVLASTLQRVPCESLRTLSIPGTTITEAQLYSGGMAALPEYCRVTMVLKPTSDSNINVDLWMPIMNWNGKFLAIGNGGWGGSIQGYSNMQAALRHGYATAGTDTGHTADDGPSGMFALGHPEKIVDFAYRAVHDMAVKSKRVMEAFYDQPLEYSYFLGISTGGRQALMEAQRYPGDFDDIIAGAPVNRHIHQHAAAVAMIIQLSRHPDQAISQTKAATVSNAIMDRCDIYHEGFLNNPLRCDFDFASLLCNGPETFACLTEAQLQFIETLYGGVRFRAGNYRRGLGIIPGELVFPGQPLGSDLDAWLSTNEVPFEDVWDTVRILGFQNADLDWHDFNLERDMPIIDRAAGFVDAADPDLRGFKGHGGKLLIYHGWNDPHVPAGNTIQYYENVLNEMGGAQDDWMRLFLIPGMDHSGNGNGPVSFNLVQIIERWREEGIAPDQIMGSNPQSGLTRPLCPYPRYAEYNGSGNLTDGLNWTCREP